MNDYRLRKAVNYFIRSGNEYVECYAQYAIDNWYDLTEDEFKTQMLYIKCNASHLRGAEATMARHTINEYLIETA